MGIQKRVEQVDFHVEHLVLMDWRDEEANGIMTLEDAYDRFRSLGEMSIAASTYISDGRIIFCAGYHQLWPGVIECWMVPSKYVKTIRLEFCKILRKYVDDIIREQKCHRFQTSIPDDEPHARWMEFLGLKREGVLRKYTHNQKDYVMYARTI